MPERFSIIRYPAPDNTKTGFNDDQYRDEALERYKKAKDLGIVTTEELVRVGFLPYPATAINTYLAGIEDDGFIKWLAQGEGSLEGRSNLFKIISEGENVSRRVLLFLKSEHKTQVMQNTSYSQLRYLESELRMGEEKGYLFEHSYAIAPLVKFDKLRERTSWHQRIMLLSEYAEGLERTEVEDSDFNKLVLIKYLESIPPDQKVDVLERWKKLKLGEKMYMISTLRNGMSFEQESEYRRFLIEHVRPPDGSRKLKDRVEEEEQTTNPLAHLIVRTGWEREHIIPKGLSESNFRVLNKMGFKKGGQGNPMTEDSPGPFRSSLASRRILLLYEKYGLVDKYKKYKDTLHFNVEVPYMDGTIVFLRWLQATGYAYEPVFGKDGLQLLRATNTLHPHQILSNNQEAGPYREFKAFDALTSSGMARVLKRGATIACALKAYQQAVALVSEKPTEMVLAYMSKDMPLEERQLTRREIDSLPLTKDQKKLAYIWIKYQNHITSGFSQVGVGSVLSLQTPVGGMNKFGKQIEAVLPKHWSRYHVNTQKVKGKEKSININGQIHPNIVAFSRSMLIQAHTEVENVFDEALADFKTELAKVVYDPTQNNLDSLFARFPCGTNRKTTFEEKIILARSLGEKYL